MNRLTFKKEDGTWGIKTCDIKDFKGNMYGVANKLLDYEEAGLSPDEILNLNDFSTSQLAILLAENSRLNKKIQFWKSEAIKAQSELGEKLIKSVKLDDLTTDMAEHICDNLCKYPEVYNGNHAGLPECDGVPLEDICTECKMGKYICDILNHH